MELLPEEIWSLIFEFDPTFRKDVWGEIINEFLKKTKIYTEMVSWKIGQSPTHIEKREKIHFNLNHDKKIQISIFTYATNADSQFMEFNNI